MKTGQFANSNGRGSFNERNLQFHSWTKPVKNALTDFGIWTSASKGTITITAELATFAAGVLHCTQTN